MYTVQTTVGEPDPALSAVLEAGLDAGFERGRATARTLIEDADAAFWLQAVGDGTPIADRYDVATATTPHQIAHVAGYDDTLPRSLVTQIATALFAHHLGVTADPAVEGLSSEEILSDNVSAIVFDTRWYYDYLGDDAPSPQPDDMDAQRRVALDLLDDECLTGFWLQAMTDGRANFDRHAPIDPETPSGEWHLEAELEYAIEYVYGTPNDLDWDTYDQIDGEYLAQHLFVATRTAGDEFDARAREAAELALERDWIHETLHPS